MLLHFAQWSAFYAVQKYNIFFVPPKETPKILAMGIKFLLDSYLEWNTK